MKSKVLFWIGLLALIGVSCMDNIDQGNEKDKNLIGDEIMLNLSIEGNRVNTYGTVEPIEGEDHIYSLYLFFFEPSVGGTGQFLEVLNISPDKDENNPGQYLRSGDKISIRSADLQGGYISLSEAYNILLLANAREYLEYYGGDNPEEWTEKFRSQELTENDLKRLRFRLVPQYNEPEYVLGKDFTPSMPALEDCLYDNSPLIEPETLMMSASVSKEAGQETLNAELVRIVTRFDVFNTDDNYTLKTASIWNGFRMGTIALDALTDFSIPRIIRLYGITADVENEITGGLYSFENYVVSPEQNDDQTTCLILGFENQAGKTSYYRVNVCLPGRAQQLKRNNAYQLIISRIKGSGDSNELDAYQSPKQQIEFQINYWDRDNQGAIVYDGDNILAITSSTIIFPFDGGTETIDIFTSGEGMLEIAQDATPNGIHVTLKEKELKIVADPSNEYKDGYVKLRYGKLEIIVNVRQSGSLEQILDIFPTSLPIFKSTDNEESEEITVTSSGKWSAKIYNGDGIFVFKTSGTTETTGGNDSEDVTTDNFIIKTIANNPNPESRHAFVHFTLDENPDLARVLLLTQNGSGNIEVKLNEDTLPYDNYIYFDADGNFVEHRKDVIPKSEAILIINTGEDQSSEYRWITGFPNGPGNFSTYEIAGEYSKLEVKATRNEYDKDQTTILRIQSKTNSSTHQLVTLIQEAHTLTYTPSGFQIVSANGGSSEKIEVTASAPFTAKLISQDIEAYFDVNNSTTLSLDPANDDCSFKVVFPRLTNYYAIPTVFVELTIDGTQVNKTFEIKQSLPVLQSIIFQGIGHTYGTLYHTDSFRKNYVEQFYESITNQGWFGTEGIVPVKDVQIKHKANDTRDETTILVANLGSSAAEARRYMAWLNADSKHVLMVLQDLYAVNFMDRLATASSGYTTSLQGYSGTGYSGPGSNNAVPVENYARTVNGIDKNGNSLTVTNNKLYEYLFKTGPFTTGGSDINPSDIFLLPYDDINNALKWENCPSTMIPLIMDRDNKYVLLGIDPTNRFVFCGEMELLGKAYHKTYKATDVKDGVTYTGVDNYSVTSPHGDTNLKFINNLISWMVNVNLYGEEFTRQFIY